MKHYEEKGISGSVADVDTTARRVKVAVSETESKDLDNDVIDKSAYNDTIKQRGPKGSNMIWHLTDHNASLKSAIGKPSDIYMDGNKLVFVTDIANTSNGNDMLELYKSGVINQHSVGFRTLKDEPVKAGTPDEYRLIKDIMLYEGSAVLWGANANTPTISVGKGFTLEEAKTEFQKTIEDLSTLHKLFKNGHLTDATFELIELKVNQLTEKLNKLYEEISQPVVKTVDPGSGSDEAILKALSKFVTLLKN